MIWFIVCTLVGMISNLQAQAEHIQQFESTITVQSDGWLAVQEHIVLHTTAQRHGIVREFPTTDLSFKLFQYHADFRVERILLDDKPVNYRIATMANGKAIYIGDATTTLAPGIYTYTIEYRVKRLVGFFKEHDELWFNVTGNGWRLPIAKVIAHVILPAEIPSEKIKGECYTGYYGSQEKNCTVTVHNNRIDFQTTKPLYRFQGLSVVATWPKGFIAQPGWMEQMWYFVKDNLSLLWLILVFTVLIVFYLYVWLVRIRPSRIYGTIVPLFYPPASLTPAEVRYLVRKGFDTVGMASEIVNMAVKGLLTIKHIPSNWGNAKYQLTQVAPGKEENLAVHKLLQAQLFPNGKESVILDNSYNATVESAQRALQGHLTTNFASYIDTHGTTIAMGIAFAFVATALLFFVDPYVYELPWFWLFIVATVIVSVLFYYITRGYTNAGQRIYEEIQGFQLFLATTEIERLSVIGTPPTRTPELYETYLPYAMALGVEQAWSAQFAPLFEQMAREKRAYTPGWYYGPHRFGSPYFGSSIGSGLDSSIRHATTLRHTPISSSSIRPGSRSGSGGRGFSGGGGGGGGGGTW